MNCQQFDELLIIQVFFKAITPKITNFQVLNHEDLLFCFVLCDSKLHMYTFKNAGRTNQGIWRRLLRLRKQWWPFFTIFWHCKDHTFNKVIEKITTRFIDNERKRQLQPYTNTNMYYTLLYFVHSALSIYFEWEVFLLSSVCASGNHLAGSNLFVSHITCEDASLSSVKYKLNLLSH